ncbi:hypothetical protein BRC64_10075 [Halobacteriales archaeon QH_10_67_22]|nr:MAG: hypothetical protein BRC64_10075 [Halobacteriales archaeon QH_10_67_22]
MDDQNDPESVYEVAIEAFDEETFAEMLELAAGEECEEAAASALKAVTAETVAADVQTAVRYARRRGRTPTGEDVGTTTDQRRDCGSESCGPFYPLSARGVW